MLLFLIAAICLVAFLGVIALVMLVVHRLMGTRKPDIDLVVLPDPAVSPYPKDYDPDPSLVAILEALERRKAPPGDGQGRPGRPGL